jgi:hypothetical protein
MSIATKLADAELIDDDEYFIGAHAAAYSSSADLSLWCRRPSCRDVSVYEFTARKLPIHEIIDAMRFHEYQSHR